MNPPIKNDPNDRIARENPRVRKNEPKDDKFQAELDSTKSVPKLKKHSRNLDSESDDELGKIKDDKGEQVSLFDLSASSSKKKPLPGGFIPDETDQSLIQKPQNIMGFPDPHELMNSTLAQTKVERGTPEAVTKLQEIVQKMLTEIHQMELKGKTDTIVTLNHPPLLKGAQLVMTSFDSAKGELNIAFENLTQQAKTFLDSNNHLDLLKLRLEEKGYITHMIITTTIQENRVSTQTSQQPHHRNDERDQSQQQQGKNRDRQQDENET